jgi:hypothetical protein
VRSSGIADPVVLAATQHPISELPEEALIYLLASRYCETDLLTETAWKQFGNTPLGWARVQAICDFVHSHNGSDFAFLAANFNKGASQASDLAALDSFASNNGLLADVPEPATSSLLLIAGAGIFIRRRRKQLS